MYLIICGPLRCSIYYHKNDILYSYLSNNLLICTHIYFFSFVIIFLEREEERERGRETFMEENTLINCLLYAPQPGTEPTTQACALTGN